MLRSTARETAPGPTGRIPTLDGWRGIAIALVLLTHVGAAALDEQYYFAHSLTRRGVLGVSVFFGMSGLLITRLLLLEFGVAGRVSLPAFYIRRWFRIQPALLTLLLVLALLGCYASKWDFWSSVLFWRNYAPTDVTSVYTGHIWSLSVEEHFYLLWPVVLVVMLKAAAGRGDGGEVNLGTPLLLTFGLAVAAGLWRAADSHWGWVAGLAPWLDPWMRTDYRIDGLLFGCVMAFLMDQRWRSAVTGLLRPPVVLAVCGLLAAAVFFPTRLSASWIAFSLPLLILSTSLHPQWLVSRILEARVLTFLGRLSYSLYLWQQLFVLPSWHPAFLPWSLQRLPLSLIAALTCALLSYTLIERPMLRVGRRLSERMAAARGLRDSIERVPPATVVQQNRV